MTRIHKYNLQEFKLYLTKDYYHIFIIDRSFRKCMSSVRITCGSQELRRVSKTTYTDCETLCKEDSNCKFMYHVPGEYCLRYPSCNVTRTATETIGSTY